MTTAQDFLMGAGGATAKFPTIDTSVSGRIVADPQVTQQTEYGTNKPLTWDDGRPRMQLVVQVQTDERDSQNAEDDGVRSLYVKGKSLTNAVREAVRKAGAPGLEVGGVLTVTYVADGQADRGNPPKLYTASYQRPVARAASEFLNSTDMSDNNAPASPTPAGQPPQGVDPAIWQQMGADQRASVLAAMQVAR